MKRASARILLFTGDSVTDCGRTRPVGEGAGLGDGYVAIINRRLARERGPVPFRVLNTGVSGDRVPELEARWEADVAGHRPDWLSVLIGINDVWRQHGTPPDPDPVPIGRYEETLQRLLAPIRPSLQGLVLMSPYMIEPDRSHPMRRQMDAYGEAVRRLAGRFDAVFLDLPAEFDALLKRHPPAAFSPDGIHPNAEGHGVIARAFFRETGFSAG